MKFSLDLIMENNEGALERVLGRLRQRSFAVHHITAGCSADGGTIKARIGVESERPIEPFIKHLAKLYDVKQIAVNHSEANVSHAPTANDARQPFELCASL